MKKILGIALLCFFCLGMFSTSVHAQTNDQIYGIWFYQQPYQPPNNDQVKIVTYNHVDTYVTNDTFGLSYTDAATQRCTVLLQSMGLQLQYLVRYRQDPMTGWTVYCYTDQINYIVFSGMQFGQSIINAAVARAQCIVYQICLTI